jgi:hypothetical protein
MSYDYLSSLKDLDRKPVDYDYLKVTIKAYGEPPFAFVDNMKMVDLGCNM